MGTSNYCENSELVNLVEIARLVKKIGLVDTAKPVELVTLVNLLN